MKNFTNVAQGIYSCNICGSVSTGISPVIYAPKHQHSVSEYRDEWECSQCGNWENPKTGERYIPVKNDIKKLKMNIKKLRESLSLSQAEFGEMVGVSQSIVSRWETGERKPEKSKIKLIKILFCEHYN